MSTDCCSNKNRTFLTQVKILHQLVANPTVFSAKRSTVPAAADREARDMSAKRCASTWWRHGLRPRRLVPPIVLAVMVALFCGFHAPTARAASSPTTPIWSTQLDFDNNGTPWSESFFAGLVSDGLTTAELNMPWGTIEPQPGTFSFTEWDTELANASAAGIQLIPIFWQAGWGGSPAPWISDFEVGSGGAQGQAPTWWDPTEQAENFTYITESIKNAVSQPGGYGGAI